MTASSDRGTGPVATALRDPIFWTAAGVLGVALWLLVPQLAGIWPAASGPREIPEIDLICRETGEVFRLRVARLPAEHPRTGRATLVPAVYDRETSTWKPGPPPEARQRMLHPVK